MLIHFRCVPSGGRVPSVRLSDNAGEVGGVAAAQAHILDADLTARDRELLHLLAGTHAREQLQRERTLFCRINKQTTIQYSYYTCFIDGIWQYDIYEKRLNNMLYFSNNSVNIN